MCGCNRKSCNVNCCPDAQIFQEEICGDLQGVLPGGTAVWTAPTPNDYFEGTFEIFNAGPVGDIIYNVIDANGNSLTGDITVPPGTTISRSVNNPFSLHVRIDNLATHGKFCIILYKRLFG